MGHSRIIFLAALLPILIGCASLDSAPKKENLAQFGSAYIVPLEDTPLGIDPTFKYIIPAANLPAAQITFESTIIYQVRIAGNTPHPELPRNFNIIRFMFYSNGFSRT